MAGWSRCRRPPSAAAAIPESSAIATAPVAPAAARAFAGEHATDEENLALLVSRVPAGSPLAYVDCARAVERVFEGRCEGHMAVGRRGSGGFGYDPVFVPDEGDGRTMAELASDEKDAISHRGRALRLLAAWLQDGDG